MTIQVTLNGEPMPLPEQMTLDTLLVHLGHQNKRVAIEHNSQIVSRSAHQTTNVCDGDHLEIVVAIGGG